jgi:hypothetical protein
VGDRLINEHDESQEHDLHEELCLVSEGATFELDGERVDAPAGTLVFVRPEVKRTAFAEEPGTTLVALGGTTGYRFRAVRVRRHSRTPAHTSGRPVLRAWISKVGRKVSLERALPDKHATAEALR